MTSAHYILATAGHVDHGKSALVKALTGTDPDRLPEEKARGITIDLGFAHLQLSRGDSTYDVGIVDVPGHEYFVKNMVAGIGSIDVAMLIVAADDGWMPQTEEHLQILDYLGVSRGVVALTKSDLATDVSHVRAAIRERLENSALADAPIIATSVLTGAGLDELRAALIDVLARTPAPADIGKPRLPIDRVFALKGVGTVVTGTLTGGSLRRGQPVVVQPSNLPARVRSLQSHSREIEVAHPGSRVAINLPELDARADHAALTDAAVRRGDVITVPELSGTGGTRQLGVVVERSARDADAKTDGAAPRALRSAVPVHFHHGSGDFAARIQLLDAPALLPGQRGLAIVRLDEPVFAFVGDRFIVRDWPAQHTLAGGTILDTDPRKLSSPRTRELLAARATSPGDATALVRTELAARRIVPRAGLLARSRLSTAQLDAAVSALSAEHGAVATPTLLIDAELLRSMQNEATAAIDAIHRAQPQLPGMKLADLRPHVLNGNAQADAHGDEVFAAVLAEMCRDGGFVRDRVHVRRASHRPALPPNLLAAGNKIRIALAAKPFEPPNRKELAPDAASQQALRFLLDTGEAVAISPELVLRGEDVARATQLVRETIQRQGRATASELRQALGTTRRVMMPLLEWMDQQGVTLRNGDFRTLRAAAPSPFGRGQG